MGSVCAEQQKLHHLFSSSKNKILDIPPRKLLGRKAAAAAAAIASPPAVAVAVADGGADMFSDSPRAAFADSGGALQKFLPYNRGGEDSDDDDSDSDPYSSDHFRMFEFKVRRCTRSRSHDWTDCPFAHPGEKARRRDPRRFHYSGTVCAEYRRGSCTRADNCEFAHGVFECWLHPSRYRTEACKDGKNCKRKVCFFAHTPRQLRILPVQPDSPSGEYHHLQQDRNHQQQQQQGGSHQLSPHCCMLCHHHQHSQVVSSSPTSTLMGMSPPLSPSSQSLSPPLSPMKHRSLSALSPISRYADRFVTSEQSMNAYKEVLNEIMGSLEAMNMNHHDTPVPRSTGFPWVDVSGLHCTDDQPQFILSPATPPVTRDSFHPDSMSTNLHFPNNNNVVVSGGGDGLVAASDPDLGWVNDLLT